MSSFYFKCAFTIDNYFIVVLLSYLLCPIENMAEEALNNNYISTQSITTLAGKVPAQIKIAHLSRKVKRLIKKPLFILIIGLVIIIPAVFYFWPKQSSTPALPITTINDNRVAIDKPKATQTLNKTYTFPLRDQSGKEVSKITFELQEAEIRDEIVIKGERATAVKGRTFFILNLKITNNYEKAVQINARDYVRLIVDNADEKLAPDIHNDPVEVQAISTKYTRLGFPIDDTFKSLKLQVGEIEGKKDTINVNLK